MISNVTISLLLEFTDCASSSQICHMKILVGQKIQQLDNLRIGVVTATVSSIYLIVPVAAIVS